MPAACCCASRRPRRSRSTPAPASHELRGEIVPLRRGRHELPGVAAASLGPLGLARWHHPDGEPVEVLVYPDLPTARRLALRLRQGRAAPEGRLRRGPLGLGTDFESIRDYSPDDDIRQVNWRASARLGRPMSNQYRDRAGSRRGVPARQRPADGGTARNGNAARRRTGREPPRSRWQPTSWATAAERSRSTRTFAATIQPRRQGGRQVVRALFDLQADARGLGLRARLLARRRLAAGARARVHRSDRRAGRALAGARDADAHAPPRCGRRERQRPRARAAARGLARRMRRRALAALSVLRARDSAVARIRRARRRSGAGARRCCCPSAACRPTCARRRARGCDARASARDPRRPSRAWRRPPAPPARAETWA